MTTLAELRQQRADAYDEEDMFLVAELDREIRLSKIDARLEELDKEIKGAKTLDEAKELGKERTALRGEITSINKEAKQAEKEEKRLVVKADPSIGVYRDRSATRHEFAGYTRRKLEAAGYTKPDFIELYFQSLKDVYLKHINRKLEGRGGPRRQLSVDEEASLRLQAGSLDASGDVNRISIQIPPSPVGKGLLPEPSKDVDDFIFSLSSQDAADIASGAAQKPGYVPSGMVGREPGDTPIGTTQVVTDAVQPTGAVTAPVTVLDEATGEQIPLAEDPEYLDIFGQIPFTPEQRRQVDIMVRAMALNISGYTDPDRVTFQHVKMFVDDWMEAYAGDIPAEDWTETQILAFMKATYTENFYDEDEGRWDIPPESMGDVRALGLHDAQARNKAIEISSGENLEDAEGNPVPTIYVSKYTVNASVGLAYEKADMLQPAARENPPKTADIQEALRKALSKGDGLIDENTGLLKPGVDALLKLMAGRIEVAMYWSGDEELDGMENWELYEAMERFVKVAVAEVRKQGIDVAMTAALEEIQTATQLENSAVSKHIKGMNLMPRQVSLMDTPDMRAKIIKAWRDSGSALEIDKWLEQDGNTAVLDELEESRAKAAGEDTVKGRRDIFMERIAGSEAEGGLGINLANEDAKNVSDQLLVKAEEAWQLEQDSGGTRSLEEIQDEFIQAMPLQAEIDRRIESRFGALPPGVEEGQTAATARYDALKARADAGEELTAQEILDALDPIQGIADVAMAKLGKRIGGAREVTLPDGRRVWQSTIGEETRALGFKGGVPTAEDILQLEGELIEDPSVQEELDTALGLQNQQAELEKDRYVAGALMSDAALATAFATGDKTKLDAAIASAKKLYARDLDADVLSEAMTRTVVGAAAPLYDVSKTPGAADKFAVAGAGASRAYLEEQEKQRQREAQAAANRARKAAADAAPRTLGGGLGA